MSGPPFGIGMALGVWLAAMAVLALRRDLPVSAVLLISLGSLLNAAALVIQGSWWNALLGVLLLPVALYLPRWLVAGPAEKAAPVYLWWNYWLRRPEGYSVRRWGRVLAWALSIAIGLVIFCVFLNLFATGNPVVAMVRAWLEQVAGKWLGWLRIDWTIFQSLFKWFLGFFFFGFLVFPLRKRKDAAAGDEAPTKPFLPALPFVMLFFINLAFLIANGADLMYLWRKVLPEGIGQTTYLYQGVEALVWAAALASVFLLGMFRRRGSVRASAAGKVAGYVLILQTGLLAASVALRLLRQIEAHGFSPFRIDGFLCLASGLVLLVLLAGYMGGKGLFRRYLGQAVVVGFFVFTLMGIRTPVQLSGDLNLALMDSNPQWRFTASDLGVFDVQNAENIPFAVAVYKAAAKTNPGEASAMYCMLMWAQTAAERQGKEPASWRNVNLRQSIMQYDAELLRHLPGVTPLDTASGGVDGTTCGQEAGSSPSGSAAGGSGGASPAGGAGADEEDPGENHAGGEGLERREGIHTPPDGDTRGDDGLQVVIEAHDGGFQHALGNGHEHVA